MSQSKEFNKLMLLQSKEPESLPHKEETVKIPKENQEIAELNTELKEAVIKSLFQFHQLSQLLHYQIQNQLLKFYQLKEFQLSKEQSKELELMFNHNKM
jgi:hypothetical protein